MKRIKVNRPLATSLLSAIMLLLHFTAAAGVVTVEQRIACTSSSNVTVGQPSAAATIEVNPKTGNFHDVSIRGLLTLGIDHHYPVFFANAMDVEVQLSVQRWDENGAALATLTPSLEVRYHPFDTAAYIDKAAFLFDDTYKYTVTITGITVNNSPVNDLPCNIYLNAALTVERYYNFTVAGASPIAMNAAQLVDLDCDTVNDELEVSWPVITGAEEYQLEWTFVNDYSSTSGNYTAASLLNYDFRNNSTRITTTANTYRITLAFDHGYVLYRVRGIGRDLNNITVPITGVWSAADKGAVSSVNSKFHNTNPHEGGKNWQYSATYAEEGKKKEVVSYFDGSLRNRQSVTKVNSDNNTIVGQTIYDHQGRPAINVLPVPVAAPTCAPGAQTSIKYYPSFNQDDTLNQYSRNDFDVDVTPNACQTAATGMSTASGASNYYSPANPNKNSFQAFVANAKKFPFTQVEYTPDNTGRIRRQGGVGPEYQLGSGHETKYFYGQPNQIQLDRMFGSEVGDAAHYKKNLVIDAHGQVSITYLDQEGRTIATSLAGDAPLNTNGSYKLTPLLSEGNAQKQLTIDLFAKDADGVSKLNTRNIENDGIIFNSQLLVAYNSLYTFQYTLAVDTMWDACLKENVCFNCVYDLEIKVTDECGVNQVKLQTNDTIHKTIGKFTRDNDGKLVFNTVCVSPTTHNVTESVPLNLVPGSYTVSKVLTINKDARDYYVDAYMQKANNSCVKSLQDFIDEALASVDTTDCSITCDQCILSLGDRDDFVASGKGTELQYDLLYEECSRPCKRISLCEASYQQLLSDVSPDGQYGEYLNSSNQINASGYPLSVYNLNNILPANFTTAQGNYAATANWQKPLVKVNGTNYPYYLEDNGDRSIIVLTPNSSGGYVQQVINNTSAWVKYNSTGDYYYTYPENLQNLSDFIPNWKPSWAKSLVQYHPEYCYYEICAEYGQKQTSQDKYTSDRFDELMQTTNEFDDAVTRGLIKPGYATITNPTSRIEDIFTYSATKPYDAFVVNSATFNPYSTQLSAKFYNYQAFGSVNYSMVEVAAITARCGTQYNTVPAASCKEFGADVDPTNPALNDSIRNKEWNLLKGFYLAEKQRLQQKRADDKTKGASCKAFNGCIGNTAYNPYTSGMLNIGSSASFWSSPFFDRQQPCNAYFYQLYAGKKKRFISPSQLPNQSANAAGYQLYLQTGQCPVAFQLQNLMGKLASDSKIASVGGASLQNYPEFTPDLYNVVNNNVTPPQYIAYKWKAVPPVTGNVLNIEIVNPVGNVVAAKLTLDKTGSGIGSWSSIINFKQLVYTSTSAGMYNFTISAALPGTGFQQYSYKTIKGSVSFNIADCGFKDVCSANQVALDLSTLMTALAANSNLTSSNVALSTSALYQPLLTTAIKNTLGTPNTDLRWSYAGSGVFNLYDNSNNADKLVIKFNSYTPSSFTASNIGSIKGFSGIASNNQNFFIVKGVDASGNEIVTINGGVEKIKSGNKTGVSMGDCELPEPIACMEQEHQVREDLENLLKDMLINGNSISTSPYFTPLLQSYLPDTLNEFSCMTSTHGQEWLKKNVERLDCIMEGCELNLSHSMYLDQQYSFNDLVAFQTELTGTGQTDAAGNYYDFYVVGVYNSGGTYYTDTIFGSSCFPVKNCKPCPDDVTAQSAALSRTAAEQDSIDLATGRRVMDNTIHKHNRYRELVNEHNTKYNLKPGDADYVAGVEYTKYYQKGHRNIFDSHTAYISRFDARLDEKAYLSNIERFTLEYGYGTNGKIEYRRYTRAMDDYNKRARTMKEKELVVLEERLFHERMLSDNIHRYISYLKERPVRGEVTLSETVYLAQEGLLPSSNDQCAILYKKYINAYREFEKRQKVHATCPDYETTSPIYSYNDFNRNGLCGSDAGRSLLERYISQFSGSGCPGPLPATTTSEQPGNNPACNKLYYVYLKKLDEYNKSLYAMQTKHQLVNKYESFTAFQNAGLCDCVRDYINYLDKYIKAKGKSDLALPLPIEEYCRPVTPPADECATAYDKYLQAVTAYNAFVQSQEKQTLPYITVIHKQESFTASGFCYCVDKYAAYLQSLTEGTTYFDPQNRLQYMQLNIEYFCETSKPPCAPSSPQDTASLPPYTKYDNPCAEYIKSIAVANAQNAYNQYIDSITTIISGKYTEHCLGATENFTTVYQDKEYHFTLYYYDQAGNRIRTVPPEGVNLVPITSHTQPIAQQINADRTYKRHTFYTDHAMVTTYEYNSLNQLVKQSVPDHDKMDIWEYTLPNGLDARLKITATQFVSSTRGYLSGYVDLNSTTRRGYLYTTNDGGATWTRMTDLVAADFKKVQMADASTGFAVGSNGIVLKTIDGGSSWDMIALYGQNILTPLNDLYFSDANTGVIVGNNGVVLKTVDGGDNFATGTGFASSDTIIAVTFDGSNYYATVTNGTGKIYTSSNGLSWTQQTSIRSAGLVKVQYVSNTDAFAVGEDGTLLRSANAGNTWKAVATGTAGAFRDIHFKNMNHGIAIIANSAGDGELYRTFNGGSSWEMFSAAGDVYNAIYFYSADKGIAVGNNGLVKRVVMTQPPFGLIAQPSPNASMNLGAAWATQTGSMLHIVTGGNSGTLYQTTTDLSAQPPVTVWSAINPSPAIPSADANIKEIIAKDLAGAVSGTVLTQTGKLYSLYKTGTGSYAVTAFTSPAPASAGFADLTIDAAASKVYAFDNTSKKAHSIDLVNTGATTTATAINNAIATTNTARAIAYNNSTLTVAGDKGDIFVSSTVGGTITWTDNSAKTTPLSLDDIHHASAGNVYAVGSDGTILATTNGTDWSTLPSGTAEQLNAIKFNTSTSGIVAGNNGTVFTHTVSTSSITLTAVTVPTTENLVDIALNAAGKAYIAGAKGTVVHIPSIAAPAPVLAVPQPADRNFSGIAMTTSGNAYAVGEKGAVYQYAGASGAKVKTVFTPRIKDVHFANTQNGYVIGDDYTVRHTADGGSSWSIVLPGSFAGGVPVLNAVHTTQPGKAIAVGDAAYVASINNLTPAVISVSAAGNNFTDVAFSTPQKGHIIGSSSATQSAYISTADGGTSWSSAATIAGTRLNALHVFGNNSFMAVGTNGKIIYYNSITNTVGTTAYNPPAAYATATFNTVFFHDDKNGYVAGEDGVMLKSDVATSLAAGAAWIPKRTTDNFNVTDSTKIDITVVAFATRFNGFVGGHYNDSRANSRYARLLRDESNLFSTYFWYDKLGRMVVSQNTKQFNKIPKAYSYTLYDALGRIVEVGEKAENAVTDPQFASIFGTTISNHYNPRAIDDAKLNTWVTTTAPSRTEVTRTHYDKPVIGIVAVLPANFTQDNLRKRVGTVTFEDVNDNNDLTYQHATHYSYDIHGNVKTLVQDNPTTGIVSQRFKRMDYQYDLISGKVNRVDYQAGEPDQFYHKYEYDADNRITQVYTSKDNVLWDKDAKYFYYAHGPLARTEVGDNQVQGIDYVYTLEGLIKGVNSNQLKAENDPGRDGGNVAGNPNRNFAKDAFGYTLGYYQGDYEPIDPAKWTTVADRFEAVTGGSNLADARNDLFNGNIGHMVTTITEPKQYTAAPNDNPNILPQGTAYKYDQLNRLLEMKAYQNLTATNTWDNNLITYNGLYHNTFAYDGNGNILSQLRKDENGNTIDNLTYNYLVQGGRRLQNRLYHVNDDPSLTSSYADDIDDQGVFNGSASTINTTNNYAYDEVGSIVKDLQEGIASMKWTSTGKVKEIIRTTGSIKKNLKFDYDAIGNRIAKHVYSSANIWESTQYYLRDAQGNVMAIYKKQNNTGNNTQSYAVIERPIYGSSRLGNEAPNIEMIGASAVGVSYFNRTLGNKQYEGSNHLGNVLAVFTDKKVARDDNSDNNVDYYQPEMIASNDYSAYGALLEKRNYSSTAYRYGFNGKESDSDWDKQDYGMRIYDGRIGRFLSVDPLDDEYPWNSVYSFSESMPIRYIDLDGEEKKDPLSKCFDWSKGSGEKKPRAKINWRYTQTTKTVVRPPRQPMQTSAGVNSGYNDNITIRGTGTVTFNAFNIEDGIQVVDLNTGASPINNNMVQGVLNQNVGPGRYNVRVTPNTDPNDVNAQTAWNLTITDNYQYVTETKKSKIMGITIFKEKREQYQDAVNPANNSQTTVKKYFMGIIRYDKDERTSNINPRQPIIAPGGIIQIQPGTTRSKVKKPLSKLEAP